MVKVLLFALCLAVDTAVLTLLFRKAFPSVREPDAVEIGAQVLIAHALAYPARFFLGGTAGTLALAGWYAFVFVSRWAMEPAVAAAAVLLVVGVDRAVFEFALNWYADRVMAAAFEEIGRMRLK